MKLLNGDGAGEAVRHAVEHIGANGVEPHALGGAVADHEKLLPRPHVVLGVHLEADNGAGGDRQRVRHVPRSLIGHDLFCHRGRALNDFSSLAPAARAIRRGVRGLLAAAAAGGGKEGEGKYRKREEAGLHGAEHKSETQADAPKTCGELL